MNQAKQPVILCVDDQQPNLKLLESIFVPRGHEVVTASNGEDALRKIKSQKVDLVLLDVMMPGKNGYEVCREIKGHKKFRNIPVIMITSLSAKRDRIKGIEAGAEEFLSKPFDKTEVLARVKMLLTVKELNDKLNYAYDNINRLTAFGEDIINAFNPLEFDFMSKVDSIVSQLIRQKSDSIERPETVLVRILTEKKDYEWYRYEFVFNRFEMTPFQMSIDLGLSDTEDTGLLFYDEAALEGSIFKPFTEKLRGVNIIPTNMTCYRSKTLSIFAINYGGEVTSYDASVLNNIVLQTLFLRSLSIQIRDTEDAFEYTVYSLARASEGNDEDTGKHIVRVGLYCELLAKKLKKTDRFCRDIRIQATLHDVGKIHTPSSILKKPEALTPDEWKEMIKHTIAGAKIVGDHHRLKLARSMAHTHHERWDGSGYPQGLRGEDIPLEGRIVTIADQYDALRNSRVYKPALDHNATFEILTKGDGRTMPQHFDPLVLKAFTDISSKFDEVYEAFKG